MSLERRHKPSSPSRECVANVPALGTDILRAVELARDGVAMTDADGCFSYMNQSHAVLFGYDDPSEILGRPWTVLYREDNAQRIASFVFAQLERYGSWMGELEGVSKTGEPVFQEVTLSRSSGGLLCVTRGVTVREQLREERARLASLVKEIEARQAAARLGSQIGHDLANFLAAIRFHAEVIGEADLREMITRATDRAFEVVKYLQDTARRELSPPETFDLSPFLDEAADMAQALCPAGVVLANRNALGSGEAFAAVDRSMLLRAVLNLVRNSVECGATAISIILDRSEPPASASGGMLAQFGKHLNASAAFLTVADNGPGMSPNTLERLSESAFSTKSTEGGPMRGLGFLTLTALTRLYGAQVKVQTQRHVGTDITISVPADYMAAVFKA